MSAFVKGVGQFVGYTLNSLDVSSCANDIIVIRHADGTLHSSPWNVRFGKLKVLNRQEKVINIEVNGQRTDACMKLGPEGEAFWILPTTSTRNKALLCSPLASPALGALSSPTGRGPGVHVDPMFPLPPSSATLSVTPAVSSPPTRARSGIASPVIAGDPAMHASPLDSPNKALLGAQGIPTCFPPEAAFAAAEAQRSKSPLGAAEEELSAEQRRVYANLLSSIRREREGSLAAGDGTSADAAASAAAASAAAESSAAAAAAQLRLSRFASGEDIGEAVLDGTAGDDGEMARSVNSHPSVRSLPDDASSESGDSCSDSCSTNEDDDDDNGSDDGDGKGHRQGSNGDVAGGAGAASGNGNGGGNGSAGSLPEGASTPRRQQARRGRGRLHFRMSLVPMHADLAKLNLRNGINEITFVTRSAMFGRVKVTAQAFLWDSKTKIVVSDVDGTVTRSDVLGHILPILGKDWTHPGICDLFTKMHRNGYQVLYLTARSVSQSAATKAFLQNICQQGGRLPIGPLLTAPQRIFDALTNEVAKKSHEFKISCLNEVRAAFPTGCTPFYAGFGNRVNDAIAYSAVKIPLHKIFIVDTNSVVHVITRIKRTYKDLADLVEHTFPPTGMLGGSRQTPIDAMAEGEHLEQDFNSYNFWRVDPLALVSGPTPLPVAGVAGAAGANAGAAAAGSAGAAGAAAASAAAAVNSTNGAAVARGSSQGALLGARTGSGVGGAAAAAPGTPGANADGPHPPRSPDLGPAGTPTDGGSGLKEKQGGSWRFWRKGKE